MGKMDGCHCRYCCTYANGFSDGYELIEPPDKFDDEHIKSVYHAGYNDGKKENKREHYAKIGPIEKPAG